MLALAVAHQGREQSGRRALGQLNTWSTIWLTVCAVRSIPMVRAARRAGAREQQAQIIVDLGDRADGGARIAGRRLLLDGYRGREPLDAVDIGLVHHREKLPRISRERLDVAALTLGVESVEGEG